jgi:serine/threonine protein kinase
MADELTRCPQCGKSFAATVRICPDDGTVLEHQDTSTSQLGKVLDGKYRLDSFLSHGGMGSVYRATHVMLGKTVAVKLINPEIVTSPEVVRRFQREARAATALHHPNIVAVYDLGQTTDGTLYIAMEFVDGPSLKSVIASGGPVAPIRTIALLRQIASALSFAHRHNVVHRDLKPHNVMLATTEDGQEVPKLVDFGIAKTFDDATQLTMTGFALGTPQYMAPEQAEGRPVDARSDLYSLGIILYEMLTGDVPFNDPSAPAILIKHIKEIPPAPSQKNPRVVIPAELEAISLRCLEKDPARRFQTADELIAALERAAASIPGAAAAMQATLVAGTPFPVASSASSATQVPSAPPQGSAPAPQGSAATARIEQPAPVAASGTRPTAVQPQGAAPGTAAASPSSSSNKLGLVALVMFLLVAGAGAFVYMKQERAQSVATSPTEPPAASPAMAAQTPPQTPTDSSTPAAQSQPGTAPPSAASGSDTAAPPAAGSATPGRSGATTATSSGAAGSARGTIAAGSVTVASGAGASATNTANASAGRRGASVGASRTDAAGKPGRPASGAGASETAAVQDSSAQVRAAQVFPEHPTVFFQCAGAPEVCSVLRTSVEAALDKSGFGSVRNAARADIAVSAAAGGVQERVSQEFKTTFAVRTYSIELNGETTRTSETVPMPTPTNVSFDPQFGSERVVEKARLVASELIDKLKAFTQKKRGG